MANQPTAFTLNSVSTTGVIVTINAYGTDADGTSGVRPDTYLIKFTQANNTTRTFTADTNTFTLDVAVNILFTSPTQGIWDVAPTAAPGDSISVYVKNDTNKGIQQSSVAIGIVSGGGGVPCFVAASNLLTATGYKSAKDIKTGDLLMTADGRKVPVKAYSYTVEHTTKESAPFLLPANSLGTSCPKADLHLSPWHAIEMKKGLWMKPMSAFELGAPIKQYDIGKTVTFYHFEAPNFFKDNLVCDGTVVESFGANQFAGMKPNTVYKYNPNLKAYTRLSAKPSKTLTA